MPFSKDNKSLTSSINGVVTDRTQALELATTGILEIKQDIELHSTLLPKMYDSQNQSQIFKHQLNEHTISELNNRARFKKYTAAGLRGWRNNNFGEQQITETSKFSSTSKGGTPILNATAHSKMFPQQNVLVVNKLKFKPISHNTYEDIMQRVQYAERRSISVQPVPMQQMSNPIRITKIKQQKEQESTKTRILKLSAEL